MQDPVSHDDRDADGTLDQANTQPNQDASNDCIRKIPV